VLREQLLEAKPLEEVVEEGQRSDLLGAKGLPSGTRLPGGAFRLAGT